MLGAVRGLLSPVAASLLHNGGSVLVVLASASLLAYKDRDAGSRPDDGGDA